MKVDMSPPAVTARLRTLDELWLLSIKLMKSKKIQNASENASESRLFAEEEETQTQRRAASEPDTENFKMTGAPANKV